jgi:N-acetylneuraminate synthase
MKIHEVMIGNKIVGDGHPCFITAEAGSNHDKNLEQAKKLIDIAVAAKADAVKFQTFRASKLYTENAGYADYLGNKKSIFEIIRSMEMPYEWISELAAYCQKRNIIFFSAPFDEESADILDEFAPCFKIASYETTHIPLLKHIAKKGKPMIISVGVTSMDEIKEAVDTVYASGNRNIILQNCVASYPAPLKDTNLNVIKILKDTFGVPAGLSDHSEEVLEACLGAVALGANIVEKHFTVSKKLPGPDHAYALEPDQFRQFVKEIRSFEKNPLDFKKLVVKYPRINEALGDGKKRVMDSEKELYTFARRSVFSIRKIKKGEVFTKDNLAVLRNGKNPPGLHPREFERILGKKSARDIEPFFGINQKDVL